MRPRSKTEDTRTYSDVELFSQRPAFSGTPALEVSRPELSGGAYRSYSGYDIERYHERVRNGELLPYTPFTQVEYKVLGVTPGYIDTVYIPQNERWFSVGTSYWPLYKIAELEILKHAAATLDVDLDPSPMVQACAAKIYAQGHDTLTFLVELHKVAALFKGLTKRVDKLLENMFADEAVMRSASAWLEYRYAWRTLVFDMRDLHRAITSLDDQRKRFTDRVGYSHKIMQTDTFLYEDRIGTQEWFIEDTIDISVRGSVSADINPPSFQFNPAVTGWEIIRFSFIIDWFLGVGTWLEALSFQVVASSYTAAGGTLVSFRRDVSPAGVTFSPNGTGDIGQASGSFILNLTTRSPQQVPLRPFANVNLDVFKVVDLVALFSKAFRGFEGVLRL